MDKDTTRIEQPAANYGDRLFFVYKKIWAIV